MDSLVVNILVCEGDDEGDKEGEEVGDVWHCQSMIVYVPFNTCALVKATRSPSEYFVFHEIFVHPSGIYSNLPFTHTSICSYN